MLVVCRNTTLLPALEGGVVDYLIKSQDPKSAIFDLTPSISMPEAVFSLVFSMRKV